MYRVVGIPANWRSRISARLLKSTAAAAAPVEDVREVVVDLSRREDLRPPAGPHNLNDTSELSFGRNGIVYLSDWCEGRLSRTRDEPASLRCHVEAGPWFGAVIENMLRVMVAYDVLLRGGVMLHCAAVVRAGCAAVLFGHSGAGKSTASALALAGGCLVVSDDLNLVEPGAEGWQVTPVPFSGTLNEASKVEDPTPLVGLFHLRKAAENRLESCSAARALSLLAGSAPVVNRDPLVAGRLIEVLEQLTRTVPVNGLHFTREPAFVDLVFGAAS